MDCQRPPGKIWYLYDEDSGTLVEESAIPAATVCGEAPPHSSPGIIAMCEDHAKERHYIW